MLSLRRPSFLGFTASNSASESQFYSFRREGQQQQCSAPHFGEVHIWHDQNSHLFNIWSGEGSTCSLCDKMPIYTALPPLSVLCCCDCSCLVLSAESRRYLKAMNLASIWDEDDRSRGSGPFQNVASEDLGHTFVSCSLTRQSTLMLKNLML